MLIVPASDSATAGWFNWPLPSRACWWQNINSIREAIGSLRFICHWWTLAVGFDITAFEVIQDILRICLAASQITMYNVMTAYQSNQRDTSQTSVYKPCMNFTPKETRKKSVRDESRV